MPRQGGQGKGKPKLYDRGMGRALMRRQVEGAQGMDGSRIARTDNMISILESNNLDDFLHMAEMDANDFEVQRITQDSPLVLQEFAEKMRPQEITTESFAQLQLVIPRKPSWTREMTASDIDRNEKDAFLAWRRLISAQEERSTMMGGKKITPFEKNLEVWRQLWRVCERSDIVIQVVDARNPLLYYTEDLRVYLGELNPPRKMLLLINKSDLLSEFQRKCWARYFEKLGVRYLFYSAYFSQQTLDTSDGELPPPLDSYGVATEFEEFLEDWFTHDAEFEKKMRVVAEESVKAVNDALEAAQLAQQNGQESSLVVSNGKKVSAAMQAIMDSSEKSYRYKIFSREELLGLLDFMCRDIMIKDPSIAKNGRRATVGMVGYPNVGKSSLINTLLGVTKANHGKARVGVSATPGKTKHFQTLIMSEVMTLCDCPGLVFPSFMNSTGEMLCSGMLPINQMRDSVEPARLMAERIPVHLLEATYGMKVVRELDVLDNPNRPPTPSELLSAYCRIKGFITGGTGRWDEFRACKEMLRDFNDGVLLYVSMPPAIDGVTPEEVRRVWIWETEKTLTQRKKIAVRLQQGKQLSAITEEAAEETMLELEKMAEIAEKERKEAEATLAQGIYEYVEEGLEDEFGNVQLSEEMIAEMAGTMTAQGVLKREHKRMKTWGKKGRKLRDKDPYGDGPNAYAAFVTNRNYTGNALVRGVGQK